MAEAKESKRRTAEAAAGPAKQARREPNVAALLSWILPGAGHLYLGAPLFGLALFATAGGLYWLGLALSDGMTFEFLDPELRGALAPVLSPEIGNLGAFLWQLRSYGYGPDYPRPFPSTIELGSILSAASGILAIVTAVHAHVLARDGSPRRSAAPALAVGLTWLVPGLGHLRQGRRLRAALVFGALVGLFALGTVLAEATNLSRERHFYYWSGQFLLGLPAIAAQLAFGDARVDHEISFVDAGLVFACVAGLLNVLAMIDAFAWSESELLGLPKKSSAHEREAAA